MQIREEQMTALAASSLERFGEEMVRTLSASFPERVHKLGDKSLLLAIREGIARASRYGIDREFDVERYLELMIQVCLDLDTNPATDWAKEILEDEGLNPADRLDHLEAHAVLTGWIPQ